MEKSTNSTLVVNLFAGPGAGKSTIASYLYYRLKVEDIECELVREYAKELIWEERTYNLSHGHYVASVQLHRIEALLGKVQVIITDSPVILALPYIRSVDNHFINYIINRHNKMYTYNSFVKRNSCYKITGRNENKDEAIEKDREILSLLEKYNVPYTTIDTYENNIEKLLDSIKSKITQAEE